MKSSEKLVVKSKMEYILELPPVYEGPQSKVYRAQDLSLGRTVGIKEVECAGLNPKTKRTMRSEINVWCDYACKTNKLPQIFYFFESGTKYYIVMQWIKGDTLRECMKRRNLSYNMKLVYCMQLCDALAPIHKDRKQHKDIKPENIMITPDNKLYMLDFNISAAVSHVGVGTNGYLAPELSGALDCSDVSRTDIFAVGAVMYELFTGILPAFGMEYVCDPWDTEWKRFEKPVEKAPDLHQKLGEIIEKCMALNPKDRYQNASEIARALRPLRKSNTNYGGNHK